MEILSKELIDKTIARIGNELAGYEIKKENLSKFSDQPLDKEYFKIFKNGESDYFKFLPLLIKKLGIKKIIELGNREGVSTAFIYDALPADAEFITIDMEKDQRYCPDQMFTDPRVKFIFGDVCDLSIFKNRLPLDTEFIFSDTIHYDFQIRDEFSVYQHLLADKALFAIDDINLNDKRKFFDELTFAKWDLTKLCHVSGWGLFLLERKEKLTREERILKAYQAMAAIWKRKCGENEAKLMALKPKPTLKEKIKILLKKISILK
jgi:predicted O-methyltransferase YrrM